jgi:formylglycine-generating enzyme required for sulfatase activity
MRTLLIVKLLAAMFFGLTSSFYASDLPALVPVPAGRYDIGMRNTAGYAGGTGDAPGVQSLYDLTAYSIGKLEISNAEFCEMMNWGLKNKRLRLDKAGVILGDKLLLDLRSKWCRMKPGDDGMLVVQGDFVKHPVTEVTWHGAMAFCALLNEREKLAQAVDLEKWTIRLEQGGFRLPTEVEWEVAAMGGKAMKKMGKGTPTGLLQYTPAEACNLQFTKGNTPTGTKPCGSLPASGFGTHDMVGNVWEWCADNYITTGGLFYGTDTANWNTNGSKERIKWTFKKSVPVPKNPVFDMVHLPKRFEATKGGKSPANADHRVHRGGAWTMGQGIGSYGGEGPFFRRGDRPDLSTNDLGFRVARSRESGESTK